LHQSPKLAGCIRLRPDPLRPRRLSRPENDNRLGAFQALVDHLGIESVSRNLVVAPDFVALRAKRLRDPLCMRFVRPRIRHEDIGRGTPLFRLGYQDSTGES